MPAIEGYDPSLQMFLVKAREPNLAHLRFLRWLAEQGLLEHPVYGPPAGQLVELDAARGSPGCMND